MVTGRSASKTSNAPPPIIGGHHAMTVALEIRAHELHDLAVIVDDEDGGLGERARHPC